MDDNERIKTLQKKLGLERTRQALARCKAALGTGDTETAAIHADEAVRLLAGMNSDGGG